MPVYQFECKKHGQFEKITIKAEWDSIKCPDCGNKPKAEEKGRIKKFIEKIIK